NAAFYSARCEAQSFVFWVCGVPLLRHLLGLGLVLIRDVELDRARRTIRDVLIAVNRAARDIYVIAGFHHTRCLALNRERDLAFLHRPPLIARMTVELVAGACRAD